jgi:hypothetical protein
MWWLLYLHECLRYLWELSINNTPNHNMTIYCVSWQTTTKINPTIIWPHILFTDEWQQQYTQSSVLWLGLSLLSLVSKHNMWSYYCWVCRTLSSFSKHNTWSYYGRVCRCCRPSINTIRGRIMDGDHVLCLLTDDNNIRPNQNSPSHILLTDRRQQR